MKNLKEQIGAVREFIEKHNSFLVAGHQNPEGDCIAATLAMAEILRLLKKSAVAYNQDPVPSNLSFLKNSDTITNKLDLSSFDAVILVDCGSLNRIGTIYKELQNKKLPILSIDHHETNDKAGDINIVDATASSTGEILYHLIKNYPIKLTEPLAQYIYCAIITDTGSFHYSNATKEAFTIAGEMVEAGVSVWQMADKLYESNKLNKVKLLALTLNTLEIRGVFASIVVTLDMLKKTNAQLADIDGLINYPRSIEGIEVAVQFREISTNLYKVSFRSKNEINVAQFSAKFGGGGHKNAAGMQMSGALTEIKDTIFKELELFVKNN